jgi:hypothetical protein
VLGDWIDPDGDPFFLASASVQGPDEVSSTADGTVVFDEHGGDGATRSVSLVVSDGRDAGWRRAHGRGTRAGGVPLVAEPFVALATAGQEITIDPAALRARRIGARPPERGAGEARGAAHARLRRRQLPVHEFGGAHALPRVHRDRRHRTATGTVRVDVSAPPDHDTTPITVRTRPTCGFSSPWTSTCSRPTSTRPEACSS